MLPSMTIQRVAILVIGDEILSGDTQETNAHYMARELFGLGVSLRRIVVVPDEVDDIARHAAALSREHDVLITCGGIGPTHDDVTLESIARAFDVELEEHPELVALLRGWRGNDLDESHLRLARVPQGTELIWGGRSFPLLRVRNVYVLPGVPKLLRQEFATLLPLLHGEPLHERQFHTDVEELAIAAPLRALQQRHPDVSFGSYPSTDEAGAWSVRLVLKARDADALSSACDALTTQIEGLEEL